ncbi:helix-turn-helix transcriptional regulator [Erythrobacter sp.]|uniref:helix-turn-helix transcriptional regulator n=1 Tax=Erythrobacter sp. TaxID=1042 RepID=UPI002EA0BBE1|nr:autoinducer binding domain-containing protein [Erythrobacter sp.]
MFDTIEALDTVGAVLIAVRDLAIMQGSRRMSYHVTPAFDGPTAKTTAVYAHGFSQEWLDLYADEAFRASDPIPARVMRHGSLMTWKEAMAAGENTHENEAYFERMREFGLEHGFGLPLYGPGGKDAYASFDFLRPLDEVSNEALGIVRSAAKAGHQRVAVLTDREDRPPPLSEREREVLEWAARGKSISAIATILDISPDTAKTYFKRIYAKLGVSDRVGAVVKALRLGLLST